MTIILICLIIKRFNLKVEETVDFDLKFGEFFEEFHDQPSQMLFYLIFILRRLILFLVIWLIEEGLLQLMISFILTLTVKYI